MIDIDKLEALRAGCISLGDPDWTAGCVRLVLEHGQAAVETDDDSIPPSPDLFCAEWITAIHNAAPALFAEVRRLRAMLPKLLAVLEVARKWEDGLASPMELALAVLDVDEPPHKKET